MIRRRPKMMERVVGKPFEVRLIPEVVAVLKILLSSSEGYLTGGFVRDLLLGIDDYHDIDVNFTDLDKVLSEQKCLDFKDTGKEFKVYSVFPKREDSVVARVDVVQLRKEMYRDESRKPVVTPTKVLLEDLSRRDFTTNAIAAKIEGFGTDSITIGLIDPYDGLGDMKLRLIKAIGDPDRRFFEDPLRMLRAVRFSVKFGFEIEEKTKESIRRNVKRLDIVSRERIADELSKILLLPDADKAILSLFDLGILQYLLPEFVGADEALHDDRGHHSSESVLLHTSLVVKRSPADLVLRLSALLHDVGKVATIQVENDGRHRFINHERISSETAAKRLPELKFSNEVTRECVALTKEHLLLHHLSENEEPSRRKRFAEIFTELREDERLLGRLISLAEADSNTSYEYFRRLLGEYSSAPRVFTGEDLLRLEPELIKTKEGRRLIRPVLDQLRRQQLYQRLGKQQLESLVKGVVKNERRRKE